MIKNLKYIIISMRPEQWTKNIFVFAGLLFAKKLDNIQTIVLSSTIFAIFCLVSSASYIFNDIIDRKEDVHHPDKSKRPVASGRLNAGLALASSITLIVIGLGWAIALSHSLAQLVGAFLLLHIIYDFALKHIPILDVFSIALSFIIRLFAGVCMTSIEFNISSWILVCTFLLALFLALCKRRAEMALLSERAREHRKSLGGYSIDFLDQLITIAAACAIISYSLYALSAESIAKHGTDKLMYTIPFVVFGVFRYLALVNLKKGGSNPEKILARDAPFLINVVVYSGLVYTILYFK